ncbi:hypothetical protein IVA80_10915 [Bradyrhizobium sp. 139]|uniref:hypothetical protein n=1 Tax=Bradyrhizobium sp. 139 TaxID=2782616 RepID=UPI001FFA1E5D|nr:hypothetical protein [Bradyrhizobium sp. 139]MCK1741361.1 hypothetical protein [Bradyrhizobium sp. 139]
MPDLPMLDFLKAIQHALNTIPRTHMRNCPGDFRDTYELANEVDRRVAKVERGRAAFAVVEAQMEADRNAR